jgi:hypothetical protein
MALGTDPSSSFGYFKTSREARVPNTQPEDDQEQYNPKTRAIIAYPLHSYPHDFESVPVRAYLRHALTRLPEMTNRQIPTITPRAYAKAQKAAAIQDMRKVA